MHDRRDLKIAFIGCVEEGRRSAETLLEMGERIDAIFTLEPARAAKVSGAVPWEDLAEAHGVPLHYVRNINDPEPPTALEPCSAAPGALSGALGRPGLRANSWYATKAAAGSRCQAYARGNRVRGAVSVST